MVGTGWVEDETSEDRIMEIVAEKKEVAFKQTAFGEHRCIEDGYQSEVKPSIGYRLIKRAADVVLSILALAILSPVFLVTAIAIKLEDGDAVVFSQKRIGRNKREFVIYKFRSMIKDSAQIHEELRQEYGDREVSFKLKDDPRVTKVGKVIRKFNIDELPQLLNILKGDMSFVGPRPLPVYEFEEEQKRYGEIFLARYQVPQGLTCLWQISERGEKDFSERMQMDVEYAKKCSIWLDMKLFALTAVYTIVGKAAY